MIVRQQCINNEKTKCSLRSKNMICEKDDCEKRACFNFPGETVGRFCATHKQAGMEDVKNKRCEHEGCNRHPAFNSPGETVGRFCATHKQAGMEDVKNKRCNLCQILGGSAIRRAGSTRAVACAHCM
jgi:hypothetical protein